MMLEEWRSVVGYEQRYSVSNLGRVMVSGPDALGNESMNGRVLGVGRSPNGYVHVTLSLSGHKRTHDVHRLVAAAFLGPCPDGFTVNHKDGIKSHNALVNLEYVTRSENQRHALDVLGFQPPHGESHCHAKLNWDQVKEIRHLAASGLKQTEIAKRFGKRSTSGICDIINFKAWRGAHMAT